MSTEQVTTMGSLDARTIGTPVSSSDNQKKQLIRVGVIAGLLIAVVGGYFAYKMHKESLNEEGLIALSRLRSTFEAGEYSKALTGDSIPKIGSIKVLGLKALADEYSGTNAGMNASLMAGNCLVNLGKFSEASPYFEDAEGSDAPLIRMGALKGLGICAEGKSDFAGAASYYEKSAEAGLNTGFADQSLLLAGFAFEKANQKDKAGEMFKTIVNKYQESESVPLAKSGLARLGMAID